MHAFSTLEAIALDENEEDLSKNTNKSTTGSNKDTSVSTSEMNHGAASDEVADDDDDNDGKNRMQFR